MLCRMSCVNSRNGILAAAGHLTQLFDNQLLSIDRLAEYLDVPTATIRDWCYKRQIPFVKVGRHVRFQPSDVQRWLSERSHGNGHPKD